MAENEVRANHKMAVEQGEAMMRHGQVPGGGAWASSIRDYLVDAVLHQLDNPASNTMPNASFYTCLDLRNQLIASVSDLVAQRDQYFADVATQISLTDALGNPTDPSPNGLSLTDQESLLIAGLLATQELGAILDNRARSTPPPNTVDATLANPKDYQFGLAGYLGSGIQQAWRSFWTDNPLWGSSKVTNDLVSFYHRAPVLYGYASVFFQVAAEFALILSLVAGRILFLYRLWLGMLVLKCLPLVWVFTDSVIRGTIFVADPAAQQLLGGGGYDPGVFQQVLLHLVAIQDISVDVITYSFLLLIPFIPGVTDVFRKVAG